MERHIPRTGEIYKHFKNKIYQIVTIAYHSETGEQLVVYQALYGDFSCCARPLEMFMSKVDREKYPEVLQEYRFELVDKDTLPKVHKDVNTNSEAKKSSTMDSIDTYNVAKEQDETYIEHELPNPDLLAFLDADTYEDKKNLLVSMHSRMTDELINSIAASLDVSVDDGDIETRYKSLYNCVLTMARYEVNNRLR